MSSRTLTKSKKGLESQNSLICVQCKRPVGIGQIVRHKLYCLPCSRRLLERKRNNRKGQ